MKVYVVNEIVDDEYFCAEACKVFSTKEKAQAYVNTNQSYIEYTSWDDDDKLISQPVLSIIEFEMDAE